MILTSPVAGEFPAQRPVTRSLDVFFDLRRDRRLSKQSWGWWFDTPSRPLWRHCNAISNERWMQAWVQERHPAVLGFFWSVLSDIKCPGNIFFSLVWPSHAKDVVDATSGFDRQKSLGDFGPYDIWPAKLSPACMPSTSHDSFILCFPMAIKKLIKFIFEVKLTFQMLTVCWQQHSFSTHERMFLGRCRSFLDRKCLDLRGIWQSKNAKFSWNWVFGWPGRSFRDNLFSRMEITPWFYGTQ